MPRWSEEGRIKYKVTLTCSDKTKPVYTVWAKSPEYAKIKAAQRYRGSALILSKIAEEVKDK
jgi:hypothetical protein